MFELLPPLSLPFLEPGGSLLVLSLPLLAIRDLRIEGCAQTLPLGLISLDLRENLLAFDERLLECLARLFLPSVLAFTADLFALEGGLESMGQRCVAEAEQQRVDTVWMVLDRNPLEEHGSIGAVRDCEMAFNRRGAACPDPVGEFLPVSAVGRDEAIRQVGIQDGPDRADVEEAERCIVAGEEHAVPAHANQTARLPLE